MTMLYPARISKVLTLAAALLCCAGLSGCASFFNATSSSSSNSSTPDDNSNYVYVANDNGTLDGYGITTGAYTEISGMPLSLKYTPVGAVVTPANTYLYVAGAANTTYTSAEGIYGFTIGTSGALTSIDSGDILSDQVAFASIAVDPTGNFLVALAADYSTVYSYQIESDGTLKSAESGLTTHAAGSTSGAAAIAFTPDSNYVYIANNSGGITIYSFDSSTTDGSGGTLTTKGYVAGTSSTSYNDLATVTDSSSGTSYLFAALSGTGAGVIPYTIGTNGALSGSVVSAGSAPYKLAYDSSNNSLYSIDKSGAAIYTFTFASGALTSVSSYSTGTTPVGVAVDYTNAYVNVLNNGSGTLQDFTIGTTAGDLTSLNSQTLSGTSPTPLALAATHAD